MKKLGWRVSHRMNVPILFSNDSFGSANSFEKEWGRGRRDERGRGARIEGNNKDDNADDEEDNGIREEGGEWRIMGRSLFSTNKVPSTSSPSRRLRLSAP